MKYIALTAALIALIFVVAFYDEMRTLLLYAGLGLLAFAAIVGVLAAVIGAGMGWEKWGTARAERIAREIENEAARNRARIIDTSDGTWFIQAINPDGTLRIVPLHSNPLLMIDGERRDPVLSELMAWDSYHNRRKELPATSVAGLLPEPAKPAELMPILDKAQRVLIKAASDGGKTTLLQHIADRRQGAVLILDSQSYPGKWPARCKVVGTGSNHQAISVALDNLVELMVKRYKEIGEGVVKEGEHPKLTIVIDEWMAIVSECPNSSDVIRRLLTESRKAAFSVFIGSHSERVKALGLDGRGDLRDGFLIIRIEMENGERKATYDSGRGEMPCILPGQFVKPSTDNVVEIEVIELPVANSQEQRILDMLDGGKSARVITETIWQQRGTFYNDKIREVARKFGREVRI